MPIVNANKTLTDELEIGRKLTVVVSSGGSAALRMYQAGQDLGAIQLSSGSANSFGPFTSAINYAVDCFAGSADVNESQPSDDAVVLGNQAESAIKTMQPSWRGFSQAMSLAVQGFGGGTNIWSMTHRTRHYSNVRFRRVRAVLQCFYPNGTPITDTLFTTDYNFQVGFEKGYTNAVSGLQPRKPFTFGGSTIAQFLTASPPSTGYIISDVLDLGEFVEANEFFGLWTTVEAAARTGSNLIPYTRSSSNFLQRYIGSVSAANTSQIEANTAFSATSVTAATSAQSGASNYFSPCMLLVETDSGLPFVFVIGDSISYGVGEGVVGSGNNGDGTGSALSNMGYAERAINENLGFNCVNVSRGSDGNKFLSTASNWQYRRALLALANPTHVINANVHNDITPSITVSARVISTAYAKWDVAIINSNIYTAVKAGTSSSTANASLTYTTGTYVDGTVIWQWVMALPGTSTPRGAATVLAQMANVNEQIRAVTSAKLITMLPTPDASSTDSWATEANQTAATNYGDATSRRGLTYSNMVQRFSWMNFDGYFDPNTEMEASKTPNTTSKWVVNGSASYVTNDGTHPNSIGYSLLSSTLSKSLFK